MPTPEYEERQKNKRLNKQYRQAAARLHGCDVNRFGEVKRMGNGAFVEIVVWVPLSEAFNEKLEPDTLPPVKI